MKKLYLTPIAKVHKFEPTLMDGASKVTGYIDDGEGGNQGNIGWGGETGDTPTPPGPDAKRNNVWDW